MSEKRWAVAYRETGTSDMPGWHGTDWSYMEPPGALERERWLADEGYHGYGDMRGLQTFIFPVERSGRVAEILEEAYGEDVHVGI